MSSFKFLFFTLFCIANIFVSINFLLGTCRRAYSQSPVTFKSNKIGIMWLIFRFFLEPGAHSRYLSSGSLAIFIPSRFALASESGSLFTCQQIIILSTRNRLKLLKCGHYEIFYLVYHTSNYIYSIMIKFCQFIAAVWSQVHQVFFCKYV